MRIWTFLWKIAHYKVLLLSLLLLLSLRGCHQKFSAQARKSAWNDPNLIPWTEGLRGTITFAQGSEARCIYSFIYLFYYFAKQNKLRTASRIKSIINSLIMNINLKLVYSSEGVTVVGKSPRGQRAYPAI